MVCEARMLLAAGHCRVGRVWAEIAHVPQGPAALGGAVASWAQTSAHIPQVAYVVEEQMGGRLVPRARMHVGLVGRRGEGAAGALLLVLVGGGARGG